MLMAFRGLQAESVAQSNAHRDIAKELTDLVAGPFDEWAAGHRVRLHSSPDSDFGFLIHTFFRIAFTGAKTPSSTAG